MSYTGLPLSLDDASLVDGVLWRRVWAWIIDFLFIAVLAAALWVVLLVLGVVTLGLGFVLMALLPAVPLAYHILFVAGRRHATPGQAMLGLTVRRENDLGPPGLVQSAVFTGLLWLTLSIGFWPLLATLFTVRHRALHDIAAGVVVVRRDALTLPPGFANMGVR
jgi:uncharacterized RDD family membrane protein YckC